MATTPILALPYPVGTDRVMDGDNAIQALAERVELKLPQGQMGLVTLNSGSTSFTSTTTPITGMSVTVTLRANRKIRVSSTMTFKCNTAGIMFHRLYNDNVGFLQETFVALATGDYCTIPLDYYFTSIAGTRTFHVEALASPGAGQVDFGATRLGFLAVEDQGG